MKKKKKILITGSINNKSNKKRVSTILLAKPYNDFDKKNYYKNTKILCDIYHWNIKKNLRRDEKYILKVYEIYLKIITSKLNQIHNVKYPVSYWRIIVGPWLQQLITIVFDRLEIIKSLEKKYKITEVRSEIYRKEDMIFKNTEEFLLFISKKEDQFNNFIFSEIIKYRSKKIIKKFSLLNRNIKSINKNNNLNFNIIIKKIYTFIFKLFVKSEDVFIIDTYFKKIFNFRLQIILKQFPFFWNKVLFESKKEINWNIRNLFYKKNNNEFLSILNHFIYNLIPKSFLEDYLDVVKLTNNLPWPKNPRAIIASTAYFTDDVFKVWTAEKNLGGANLISTQHGGNFFTSKDHYNEKHMKKISNYILAWGEHEKKNQSIIPFFNFKTQNIIIQPCKTGNLLIGDYVYQQYVESLYNTYKGPQNILFLDRKIKFLKKLKKKIINKTFIKNKSSYQNKNFGDNRIVERSLYASSNIKVNYTSEDFYEELRKSRIFVANSNQTTFLEALNLNFPTVIYFDTRFEELRDSVIPYYKILKDNKIFFEDSLKAASHINNVWDNVDVWWQSKKVQSAVNIFCNKFSKRSTNFKFEGFLNKLN